MRVNWTPEEEKFIIANWSKLTVTQMAQKLGRSYHSMSNKRASLVSNGLVTGETRAATRLWSKSEIAYLRKNFGKVPCVNIGKTINRSYHSVREKAASLGLEREDPGYYSLTMLARSIGQSRHCIRNAIERGELKAVRSQIRGRFGSLPYRIAERDAVEFVRKRANTLNPANVEDRFFLSVINEERRKGWKKPRRPPYLTGYLTRSSQSDAFAVRVPSSLLGAE